MAKYHAYVKDDSRDDKAYLGPVHATCVGEAVEKAHNRWDVDAVVVTETNPYRLRPAEDTDLEEDA